MNHQFINENFFESAKIQTLHHPDHNLDSIDTIINLPEQPAVFAICGSVNGKLANCRIVRSAENLKSEVLGLYTTMENDKVLLAFMKSIKTKSIIYTLIDPLEFEGRADELVDNWKKILVPRCTEEMNEVY